MTTTVVAAIRMTTEVTVKVTIMMEMMKAIEIMMERKVTIRVIPIIVIIWIIGIPIGGVSYTTR